MAVSKNTGQVLVQGYPVDHTIGHRP